MEFLTQVAEGYDAWITERPIEAKVDYAAPSLFLPESPLHNSVLCGYSRDGVSWTLSLPLYRRDLAAWWCFRKVHILICSLVRQVVTAVSSNVASDLIAQCISRSRTDAKLRKWDTVSPLRLAIWGILCTLVVDYWYVDPAPASMGTSFSPHSFIISLHRDCQFAALQSRRRFDSRRFAHRFAFLDNTFGTENDVPTLAKKITLDQVLFGPFILSSFLIFVGAFDAITSDHKFAATFERFFANVLQGHLAGMSYWLPVRCPIPISISISISIPSPSPAADKPLSPTSFLLTRRCCKRSQITIVMFAKVPPKFWHLLLSFAGLLYNIWLSLWMLSKTSESGEGDEAKAKAVPRKKSAKAE